MVNIVVFAKKVKPFFCNEQSAQRDLVHISLELNF